MERWRPRRPQPNAKRHSPALANEQESDASHHDVAGGDASAPLALHSHARFRALLHCQSSAFAHSRAFTGFCSI